MDINGQRSQNGRLLVGLVRGASVNQSVDEKDSEWKFDVQECGKAFH